MKDSGDSTAAMDKALSRWLRENKGRRSEPPVTVRRLSPEELEARKAARHGRKVCKG